MTLTASRSDRSLLDLATVRPLRLSLLGGFELTGCGRRMPVAQGSQRLVAFLALQTRPVLRQYVAGTLWPHKNEARATANLRTVLWRLSPLEIVDVAPNHLRLAPAVSVDLSDALAAAARLLDPAVPLGEVGFDDSLLACELLPDWYDDWVLTERERIRQLRLHALEALCVRCTEEGRAAAAIAAGLAAVAAEPLRESSHRVLVEAHLSEGNQAEALRQYLHYRDLLWDDLGVAPSPRITSLVAPMLADSRSHRGDASAPFTMG